jgi:hypothetical protein
MSPDEYEAAVAAFIRFRGITRCPTACVVSTQGVIAKADRAALEDYAAAREEVRRRRIIARMLRFNHSASWARWPNAALHDNGSKCPT